MNSDDFRDFGKAAIDYVADYLDYIRERYVLSSVEPGYLGSLVPITAPEKGEPWQLILHEVDKIITPGLTHWHSPHFHAYYPTGNSYPGVVAEIISTGLSTISTDSFPETISTTLEQKMLNWLVKLLNLPRHFLNNGVIQNAASESTLIALLTAKNAKIKLSNTEEGKLVAYTSDQANSSVEKAGLLGSVTMRLLPTDHDGSLRGSTLLDAIHKDLEEGFVPCCVIATFGTTGTCAFDNLTEIGPICKKFKIWLHVDAAYAGSALSCPEFRPMMEGIEFADSFCFNPHKWMMVSSDCSAMWFKNPTLVKELFKFCQIADIRKFRALKLWFVLRIYGVEGIRQHIRKQIELAKYFEELVKSDSRLEVCAASMGLVCFRVKGPDSVTQDLIDKLTQRRLIFVMPYHFMGKLMVRFVVCSRLTEKTDILFAWEEIKSQLEANAG